MKDDEGKTPLALLLDSQPEPTADNWELVMTLWKKKREEERDYGNIIKTSVKDEASPARKVLSRGPCLVRVALIRGEGVRASIY